MTEMLVHLEIETTLMILTLLEIADSGKIKVMKARKLIDNTLSLRLCSAQEKYLHLIYLQVLVNKGEQGKSSSQMSMLL